MYGIEFTPIASYVLIAVTCIVSFYAWSNEDVYRAWILNPYVTKQRNQYYRLISHGFLHADYMHLIFNMMALYFFGVGGKSGLGLEFHFVYAFGDPIVGRVVYVVLYFVTLVVASVPTYFRYKEVPHYNSLGASGAVSGVVFAMILFRPTMGMGLLFIPVYVSAFVLGIGYLIYSYYKDKNPNSNVNHNAHFYGALFGLVFTSVIYPEVYSDFFLRALENWSMSDLIQFGRF